MQSICPCHASRKIVENLRLDRSKWGVQLARKTSERMLPRSEFGNRYFAGSAARWTKRVMSGAVRQRTLRGMYVHCKHYRIAAMAGCAKTVLVDRLTLDVGAVALGQLCRDDDLASGHAGR